MTNFYHPNYAPWYASYRNAIKTATIGNSVTSIGDAAFNNCSSLTSVNIPSSITTIPNYAFGYCSSLTSVTIGSSVTSIGTQAFQNCSSLVSVIIGNSVDSIGGDAFFYCVSLTSITCHAVTPPLETGAFNYVPTSIPVYVPCGTVAAYQTAWNIFTNFIGLTDTFYSKTICHGETYTDDHFTNLTQAGTYRDTLQNINGCDSVIELTLDYYLQVPVTQRTASICEGDSYTDDDFTDLTIADTYYITLQNENGCDSVIELTLTVNQKYFTQISDSISTGGSYDFHGKQLTEEGIYYDTLQTIHDCDSIFELTLTIIVGINELKVESEKLKVFPNPTNGQLHITMGHAPLWEDAVIEIFNVVGQKLLSIESLQSLEATIDISHLAKGMYFLKVGNKVVKFVKE